MAAEKCTVCGRSTDNKCAKCKSAHYCSANCQKKDWPLHKLLCGSYVEFLKTRPTSTTKGQESVTAKVALLFPVDSTNPKLVWVIARQSIGEDGHPRDPCVRNHLINHYMDRPDAMQFIQNDHHLQLFVGENSIREGHSNKCLRHLNSGWRSRDPCVNVIAEGYCGNAVVCVMKLTENDESCFGEDTSYEDITLADLRYALNQFTQENTIFESDEPNKFILPHHNKWIKAVKISCTGDMRLLGMKKYREVTITSNHEVYGPFSTEFWGLAENFLVTGRQRRPGNPDLSPDICTISQHMGMTLRAKRLPYDPSMTARITDGMGWDPYDNYDFIKMMTETTIENENDCWGAAMPKFNIGQEHTVLITREDKKDITAQHLEALVSYCCDVFLESQDMQNPAGALSKYYRARIVELYFTSSKFEEFFEELKAKKIGEGDASWTDAVSPRTTRNLG